MLGELHGLPNQLSADPTSPVRLQHEDVAQPRDARAVRHHAAEPERAGRRRRPRSPGSTPEPDARSSPGNARGPSRPPPTGSDTPRRRPRDRGRRRGRGAVADLPSHQQVRPSRRCCSAGRVWRTLRSSVRSSSANHTPSPSSGAAATTAPTDRRSSCARTSAGPSPGPRTSPTGPARPRSTGPRSRGPAAAPPSGPCRSRA